MNEKAPRKSLDGLPVALQHVDGEVPGLLQKGQNQVTGFNNPQGQTNCLVQIIPRLLPIVISGDDTFGGDACDQAEDPSLDGRRRERLIHTPARLFDKTQAGDTACQFFVANDLHRRHNLTAQMSHHGMPRLVKGGQKQGITEGQDILHVLIIPHCGKNAAMRRFWTTMINISRMTWMKKMGSFPRWVTEIVVIAATLGLVAWRPGVGLLIAIGVLGVIICLRRPRPRAAAFFSVFLVIIVAVAFEGLLLIARHIPASGSIPVLRKVGRELYMLDRNFIQCEPEAIRWDPTLGYTLQPGCFRFTNTEFDTGYEVNSRGLRDDERSLTQADIVVLGDSFAMGWGVDQHETIAAQLERLSGLTVLNGAVSSFGTAREIRLLAEVDRLTVAADHPVAKYVVIQFCNNDIFENRLFDKEGPEFSVQNAKSFNNMVNGYQKSKRYYPLRYSLFYGRRLANALAALSPIAPQTAERESIDIENLDLQRRQVEMFLQVLKRGPADLRSRHLIVFELNSYNRHNQYFASLLEESLEDRSNPAGCASFTVLDLAPQLGPEHWYSTDDHLRSSGHRLIAEQVWQTIDSLGELAKAPAAGEFEVD